MISEHGADQVPLGEDRQAELQELGQRQTRFFATFAVVEGAVLAVIVALSYGMGIIDPEAAIWVMGAVMLLGGALLWRRSTGFVRERAEIIGKPLPREN